MTPSKLILKSGETFLGLSPKWQEGHFFGEVVFTTGMTGYVESLTDPSYAGQILTFCYPLIGNYGVPKREFWESGRIQASGVVIGTADSSSDHWNAEKNFLEWLKEEKIPLIMNVDTRALTKRLRKQGVVLGAISRGGHIDAFPDPNLTDLVGSVSCKARFTLKGGAKRVIAVDCGMKENIMRSLSRYPVELVRVPHDYDYSGEDFDALFISNGPGDPARAEAAIAILRKALGRGKPTFGICLGAQLLALAIGAKTYKLPFGHRGHNQPCFDLREKRAILTSQNHGYAIEAKSLPEDWEVTFNNLNDGSVEGIAHKTLPFSAVQFHPESSPGPTDAAYLFDKFYGLL